MAPISSSSLREEVMGALLQVEPRVLDGPVLTAGRAEVDRSQGQDDADVANTVERESRPDAPLRNDQARERGSDEARQVERHGAVGYGAAALLVFDQGGHDCHAQRRVRTIERALNCRQQDKNPDVDGGLPGQPGQHEHVNDTESIDDRTRKPPVEAVRHDAEQRAEDNGRRELREGDDANPEFRVGQLPGEPAQCDAIDPDAMQRQQRAAQVDDEIAIREGRRTHRRMVFDRLENVERKFAAIMTRATKMQVQRGGSREKRRHRRSHLRPV